MVQICALASGSNGNCYYVGNEQEAVIIDIGISNRQLKDRLDDAGLSLKKIKAVFITHEHSDHIKGMHSVSKKNDIAVYITKKTYEKAYKGLHSNKAIYFNTGDSISIGSINVHSFAKPHDASDPVSFRIEINGLNIAVLTDLGSVTPVVIDHLKLCDAAFLETNYDYELLMNGKYPSFLKHRVSSDIGHLSNHQAVELISTLNGSPLKTLFLSHISADNNKVDLALEIFKPFMDSIQIEPTSRHAISKVITL